MRIVIFGAGALGTFIGGMLANRYDVTLIGRPPHIEAIKRKGLIITGKTELQPHPQASTSIKNIGDFDLAILTVKSYDTGSAARELKSAIENINKKATILSIQNGLGNIEILAKYFGKENVVGGITSHGITFIAPGIIRHAGIGDTIIGELSEKLTHRIRKLATIFNSVGIETKLSRNIRGEIWAKVIVNCGINPLTAITHQKNGYILKMPALTKILEFACSEAVQVAKASKVKLPSYDLVEKAREVVRKTADNKSSMLQDIERGRKTEISSINGAIVLEAKRHGIQTPINFILFEMVKGIEQIILSNRT